MASVRALWIVDSALERADAEQVISRAGLQSVEISDPASLGKAKRAEYDVVLVSHWSDARSFDSPLETQAWIWVSAGEREPAEVAAFFTWGGRSLIAPDELSDAALRALGTSRLKSVDARSEYEASPEQTEASDIKRELMLAGHVQAAILPQAPLETELLMIDHEWRPSVGLSGDFVRYQKTASGQVVFLLADVAGHGAGSALVTVMLDERLNRILEPTSGADGMDPALTLDPVDLVGQLNEAMVEGAFDQHVAMALGVIDEHQRQLDWVSAGHYPPAFLRNGDDTFALPTGGFPLGLSKDAEYDSHQLTLRGDFRLMIFSDGVLEAVSGESLERQEAALERMVHLFRGHTHEALPTLTEGCEFVFADDVTVLSVVSR